MPVRSFRAAFLLLPGLAATFALADEPTAEGDYFYVPSETTVAYVGEHYWLRTSLPDNWAYGTFPT